MQRKGSGNAQFRKAIPADVRAILAACPALAPKGWRGKVVQFSLKVAATRGNAVAVQAKQLAAMAAFERQCATIRERAATIDKGPDAISQRDIAALAGEHYRASIEKHGDNPGETFDWQEMVAELADVKDKPGFMRWLVAGHARGQVVAKGLNLSAGDMERLEDQTAKAMVVAVAELERKADGDYSPNIDAARFPPWQGKVPAVEIVKVPGSMSFADMVGAWAGEKKMRDKPVAAMLSKFARLAKFLGHDDARRVTRDDPVRFKAKLDADGLVPKTINHGFLAPIKAIFSLP